MDTNERQIALSVLEALREDLTYAHLNNGSRVEGLSLCPYLTMFGKWDKRAGLWLGPSFHVTLTHAPFR